MAFWKQALIILLLVVGGTAGWGAVDPTARPRLLALGVPAAVLPEAAFLAKAPPLENAGAGSAPGATSGPPRGPAGAGGGRGGFGGPVTVVTAPVVEAQTDDRVAAIGTGEALRTIVLFPRSSGMVDEVLFRPGDRVDAAQPLVRLDDEAETIALERAEIAVADARAKLARYEQLAANRSLSAVERDAARSELAKAELELRDARLALDRREIRAPFAGVVGLSEIEAGDLVSSTSQIATLDDRSALKIEFRIPEAFAARVALGQTVEAATPSRPGEVFTGEVTALGSRIEADSRTLVVQATLANPDDVLRPGMSFSVTLRFTGETRTAVPALAVQWDRNGSFVWRVADGTAERVPVTIVERNVDRVLVTSGLTTDDVVVTEGVQRLRPGAKVASAGAAGAPAGGSGGARAAPQRPS